MRRAGLSSFLLLVLVACGRSDLDAQGDAGGAEAAAVDVGADSRVGVRDAVADHHADRTAVSDAPSRADRGATDAPDAGPPAADASPDAVVVPDAGSEAGDASSGDSGARGDSGERRDGAAEAGDAEVDARRDAGPVHLACDQCGRGDQQCGSLANECTDDAGMSVPCPTGIFTCVVGDAGCAAWGEPVACRSDIPCCVPCFHQLDCPLGPEGAPCEEDTDCAFNACDTRTHTCVVSQCDDHHQDGTETDVDCGGFVCNGCTLGQGCQGDFDCLGGEFCDLASHTCK